MSQEDVEIRNKLIKLATGGALKEFRESLERGKKKAKGILYAIPVDPKASAVLKRVRAQIKIDEANKILSISRSKSTERKIRKFFRELF